MRPRRALCFPSRPPAQLAIAHCASGDKVQTMDNNDPVSQLCNMPSGSDVGAAQSCLRLRHIHMSVPQP